jgi:hypothetical protein
VKTSAKEAVVGLVCAKIFEENGEIAVVADKLEINGIETIKSWQTKDTRSGKIIVGIVRKWTLASSDEAKRARRSLRAPRPECRPRIPAATRRRARPRPEHKV